MSGDSSTKSLVDSSGKALAESSAKSLAVRTMVSNAKFEVEKFDETNNFGIWQCEVMDVLVQQELDVTLEDKLKGMSDKDWEKINRQACGTIHFCLAKNVNFGGDMVIKPLHKFKRCLDLYGICNLNYPLGALVVVMDKICSW